MLGMTSEAIFSRSRKFHSAFFSFPDFFTECFLPGWNHLALDKDLWPASWWFLLPHRWSCLSLLIPGIQFSQWATWLFPCIHPGISLCHFVLDPVLSLPGVLQFSFSFFHSCISRLLLLKWVVALRLPLSWILCTKVNSFNLSLQGQAFGSHVPVRPGFTFASKRWPETLPDHFTTFLEVHNSLTGEPDAITSLQGRSNTKWKIQTKWPNGEKT